MTYNNQGKDITKVCIKIRIQVQVGRYVIGQLYNQNFKKFQYYQWVQSSIVPLYYNAGYHKRGRFFKCKGNIVCSTHPLLT
jgi:hypothetical protein